MHEADNLPPYCAVVKKSGSLNFLEPLWAYTACYGSALPLPLLIKMHGKTTIKTMKYVGTPKESCADVWKCHHTHDSVVLTGTNVLE